MWKSKRRPHARLTIFDVLEIRRLAQLETEGHRGLSRAELAKLFHVSQSTINHIVYRLSWDWVPETGVENMDPEILVEAVDDLISAWKKGQMVYPISEDVRKYTDA